MTQPNTSKNPPRHIPGTEPVYVAVSHELLGQMQLDWSQPVQVRLERDEYEPYGWRMTFRTVEVKTE